MSTSDQPTKARRSIGDGLRAVVRQASAGVYVFIAYAVVVQFFHTHGWVSRLEPLFVFLGAALTALLVDGPWWTVGFVGLCVAGLDAAFLIVMREEGEAIGTQLAINVVMLTAAGALGAALVRWRQRRGRAR